MRARLSVAVVAAVLLGTVGAGGVAWGQTTGNVSGTVTDATTATGLSAVYVYAYRQDGSSYVYAGYGYTDSTGAYTVAGLAAGTYYVYSAASGGYINEVYNDVACPSGCNNSLFASGTGVSVTTGSATGNISFGPPQAGKIPGTVTDATTGTGLPGAYVYAYRQSGSSYVSAGNGWTDSTGAYTISGLITGTYYLYTSPVSHSRR